MVLDMNPDRLAYLDDIFGGRVETVLSNEAAVEEALEDADLVVGACCCPAAPKPRTSSSGRCSRA